MRGHSGAWVAAWLLILGACVEDAGPDGPGGPQAPGADSTSALCPGIVGAEAIAWDLYNGVPVTHPSLPPPLPVGDVFSHPDFPLLGFSYPVGWTPETLRGEGVVGVNLLRDDGQAIYRYVSSVATGPLRVEDVVDFEVNASRSFFGLTGAGEVVCRNRRTQEVTPGTGIVADGSNVLLRIDGHSLLLASALVRVTPELPPSVFVRMVAAPTAEWQARLYDTFIAIDWQMLYRGGSSEDDRDGDGIWDVFDKFPDDPGRH